jgi:hypothetical protein
MRRKLLLSLALAFGATTLTMAQSKSTGVINLTSNMTANFTLNNTTSKVTLVLTGPSDRWFALGLDVVQFFNMSSGDVVVYSTSLTDRNFVGTQGAPADDASQDWTTVSNNENTTTGIRTLTLERALTNSDTNDFQLPYASTNSINLAWARSSTATTILANHGGANRGFATGTFTTLGLDGHEIKDFVVYPNPTKNSFSIQTQEELSSIIVYNNFGKVLGTIKPLTDSYDISFLSNGVYFLEIQAISGKKSYEKIVKE